MKINVLLVEDDQDLASTIVDYLELENMLCDHAANGVAGLTLMQQHTYDVILLDAQMPKMDGLTLCETIRARGNDTSVLMLTARDTLEDKLAGFNAGVDDYMVKPFEMLELVARINVLAKRISGQSNLITACGIELDIAKKTATRQGRLLHLSPSGWTLLELLVRKSPYVVSRQHMCQALWGDEPPDSNALKVHLFKLRQQVDTAQDKKIMHTVIGQGVGLFTKEECGE